METVFDVVFTSSCLKRFKKFSPYKYVKFTLRYVQPYILNNHTQYVEAIECLLLIPCFFVI